MCKTSKNVRLNEVQRIAYCKVNVQNKRGLLSLKLQSAVQSNEMVNTKSDVATVVILPTTNLQFAEVSVVPSGCQFQHSLCCEILLTSA